MNNYFVTYKSITMAQRAISLLGTAGIRGYLVRTPKNMMTEGCGYAVKIREDRIDPSMRVLKAGASNFGKVFFSPEKDRYDEVTL